MRRAYAVANVRGARADDPALVHAHLECAAVLVLAFEYAENSDVWARDAEVQPAPYRCDLASPAV